MVKVCSNGEASRDLVVTVRTLSDPKPLMDKLTHFVLSRLPRHHPAVYSHLSYGGPAVCREYCYRVVCGTSSFKHFRSAEEFTAFTVEHRVHVAVHLECEDTTALTFDADDLVDEGRLLPLRLPADAVARPLSVRECGKPWLERQLRQRWDLPSDVCCLIADYLEPEFVRRNVRNVGVSAVSPAYMLRLWREIVLSHESPSPTAAVAFNHCGEGYGRHPMLTLEAVEDDAEPLFNVDWRDELASEHHPARTKEEAVNMTVAEGFAWRTGVEDSHNFGEWRCPYSQCSLVN
jgi:hypothetical protein